MGRIVRKRPLGTTTHAGHPKAAHAGTRPQGITINRAIIVGLGHIRTVLRDDLPVQLSHGTSSHRARPIPARWRTSGALPATEDDGAQLGHHPRFQRRISTHEVPQIGNAARHLPETAEE